jgi:hypothetical protein
MALKSLMLTDLLGSGPAAIDTSGVVALPHPLLALTFAAWGADNAAAVSSSVRMPARRLSPRRR